MTPYYAESGVEIYHGDVLDVLASLGGIGADVTITDPPYNVGMDYGSGDRRTDYADFCAAWFWVVRGMSRAVAFTPGTVNVGLWYGIHEPDWLIAWMKPTGLQSSPFGFCKWEPILFWGKTAPRGHDVITASIVSLDVDHPCPKPLGWAAGLIRLLSDPGHLVLDPFLGSGTTAIVAKQLGRRAIGIEREERWCELAAKRVANTLPLLEETQLSLLVEA